MLCHHAEVAQGFWCCTTDCVFCNVIGEEKTSPQKVININEARRISRMSPDPLISWVGSGHETTPLTPPPCIHMLPASHPHVYTVASHVPISSQHHPPHTHPSTPHTHTPTHLLGCPLKSSNNTVLDLVQVLHSFCAVDQKVRAVSLWSKAPDLSCLCHIVLVLIGKKPCPRFGFCSWSNFTLGEG